LRDQADVALLEGDAPIRMKAGSRNGYVVRAAGQPPCRRAASKDDANVVE